MPRIVTLPCLPEMVGTARVAVRAMLAATPVAEDAETVVSEFMGNAWRWSKSSLPNGTVEVRIEYEAGETWARLEVVDAGKLPRHPTPEDDDESGRGLEIVDALSSKWGHHGERSRQVWWAEWSW